MQLRHNQGDSPTRAPYDWFPSLEVTQTEAGNNKLLNQLASMFSAGPQLCQASYCYNTGQGAGRS